MSNQTSKKPFGCLQVNLPGLVGLTTNFFYKVKIDIKPSKSLLFGLCFTFVCYSNFTFAETEPSFSTENLSEQEALWIGNKIYQNECASKPEYLTYWGKGEDFPSFGIGHFIWYPKGVKQTYEETFSQMVDYVSEFKKPPLFLQNLTPFNAPWKSKSEFDQAWSSAELTKLRAWLLNTRSYQAEFIVHRFKNQFAERLAEFSQPKQSRFIRIVEQMMRFKKGRFALIDYVNFKGFGNQKESYQGEQWGLFSVLEAMPLISIDDSVISNKVLLNEFIKAAKARLSLRVDLAPVNRKEQRWLKGWFKRLDGYADD